MNTLLLLVEIHVLILGMAFSWAGFMTLIGADAQEIAKSQQGYAEARQQGWLAAWQWYAKQRHDFTSFPRIASHWSHRPDARKLIYAGCALLAVAAVLGVPLGWYQ